MRSRWVISRHEARNVARHGTGHAAAPAGRTLAGNADLGFVPPQLGFTRHALESLALALDPIARLAAIGRKLPHDPKPPGGRTKASDELDPTVDFEFCAHVILLPHIFRLGDEFGANPIFPPETTQNSRGYASVIAASPRKPEDER